MHYLLDIITNKTGWGFSISMKKKDSTTSRKFSLDLYLYIHLYSYIFMIKEVKKYGTSGHIILPKRLIGMKVNVMLPEESDVYMTKKEIENLIKEQIIEAKAGY